MKRGLVQLGDLAWHVFGRLAPDWMRERRLAPVMSRLRSLPFHCHLIKYDPVQAISGGYDDGSWTAMSDIGQVFDGTVLTMDSYLSVEQAHLDVVRMMAVESRATRFYVEVDPMSPLTLDGLLEQVRSALREEERSGYWWNSQELDFYVIIGDDYHLYVGSHVVCVQGVNLALDAGLHPRVDEGPSPYLHP